MAEPAKRPLLAPSQSPDNPATTLLQPWWLGKRPSGAGKSSESPLIRKPYASFEVILRFEAPTSAVQSNVGLPTVLIRLVTLRALPPAGYAFLP